MRPEGLKILGLLVIAFCFVYVIFENVLLILPFIVASLFIINFFRDPERTPDSERESDLVSPADGKVILIDEVEKVVLNSGPNRFRRIAIFMSPLDVHVNRAPVSGRVVRVERIEGRFHRAFLPKSQENARVEWLVIGDDGNTVFVTQIAGAIARRIKTFKKEGDTIKRGERIGMIYFGSRVDLYVPEKFRVTVKIGDRVVAGKTVVASSDQ